MTIHVLLSFWERSVSENIIIILKSSHKASALSFDTALFESLTNKIQQIISSIILCYIIDRMRLHHLKKKKMLQYGILKMLEGGIYQKYRTVIILLLSKAMNNSIITAKISTE